MRSADDPPATTVYESEIPGVGRKFELDLDDDARLVAVLHHDGRREVFHRPGADADSEKVADLDARTARRLGAILTGTNFETVDVADLEVPRARPSSSGGKSRRAPLWRARPWRRRPFARRRGSRSSRSSAAT